MSPVPDMNPVRRGPPPTGNPGTGTGGGGIVFSGYLTPAQRDKLRRSFAEWHVYPNSGARPYELTSGPYRHVERLIPMPDPSTVILDRSAELNPRLAELEQPPRRPRALLALLLFALGIAALYLCKECTHGP